MVKTREQLETELDAAYSKIELLTKDLIRMREIVSLTKCRQTAHQVLVERGGSQVEAQLLADFISRIWWIDATPEWISSDYECSKKKAPSGEG